MNNIFEKNINALALKDSKLASKLNSYIVTDIPQLVKENGFYNLIYKTIPLHNSTNPLQEALEIFSQAQNEPVAIHLIYGIGLGYLFQTASQKSQGTVILYEPDLNILKIAFTLVDFSKDIIKNNVYIASTLDKVGEYIYRKSNMKNIPLMLSTTSYRKLDENKFNMLVAELQRMVGSYGMDLRYTKEKFYPLLKKLILNMPYFIHETPLAEFKDIYKGKTGVVVSAGPTLDRNIETIKKYRDNIILFVVGTAMKTIAQHNITPDFLCIIESNDCSKQIAGLDLSKVNFITEPFSHQNLRKFGYKNIYTHISANQPVNFLWKDIANIDISEYWSKGTVSYAALNCARILGCSKIVLVGQDLAYIEGQCYSKDSAYKDLECKFNKETNKWEITARDFDNFCSSLSNAATKEAQVKTAQKRLHDLNNSLYYVKGINGDMIPTESVYAAFIRPLKEFAEHFNDREYINTSLVGAQIDGYKNIPLEEALRDSSKIENRELICDFKYDINKIKENIHITNSNLKYGVEKIHEGQKIIKSMNNDLKRYKNINADILKTLKKLFANYIELSTVFAKKNLIFDFITTAERIDLDYEMKMTKNFTQENIENLIEKLHNYYTNAEKRLNIISTLLLKTCEELK